VPQRQHPLGAIGSPESDQAAVVFAWGDLYGFVIRPLDFQMLKVCPHSGAESDGIEIMNPK